MIDYILSCQFLVAQLHPMRFTGVGCRCLGTGALTHSLTHSLTWGHASNGRAPMGPPSCPGSRGERGGGKENRMNARFNLDENQTLGSSSPPFT
jgi:hypothetical protein